MYGEKLASLLRLNSINPSAADEMLYKTLVHSSFDIICKTLNSDDNLRSNERANFRNSKQRLKTTRQLISKYVGCEFNVEEYALLYRLLTAYFNKSGYRKEFTQEFKLSLIENQKGICPICKSVISVNNSHLDHVIPWVYVGDEISDNYQMLCSTCNIQKGSSLYYELVMLLLNKSA